MKKLIICLSFFLLNNFAYAKISLKNFQINEKNKIYSNYDVKYFINLGFKLVTQETRGTRTVYILKREEEYVACRTENIFKEETCYEIELIKEK